VLLTNLVCQKSCSACFSLIFFKIGREIRTSDPFLTISTQQSLIVPQKSLGARQKMTYTLMSLFPWLVPFSTNLRRFRYRRLKSKMTHLINTSIDSAFFVETISLVFSIFILESRRNCTCDNQVFKKTHYFRKLHHLI
jgi:hypothetical protein